jgi:putative membrane protein
VPGILRYGKGENVPGFFVRWLIVALGLWIAEQMLSGIEIADVPTLLLAAALLGFVNAFVRPLIVILTFPITLVTLGLFLFVINALMLELVAALLPNVHVAGFWDALLGSIIISATGWFASSLIGPSGRIEVLVVEQRR